MTDTLSLRERIGRTLENAWGWFNLLPSHIAYPKLEAVICADLESWVEQEIQQARELADMSSSVAWYARQVEEKDAQIAALQDESVEEVARAYKQIGELNQQNRQLQGALTQVGNALLEERGRRLRETPTPPEDKG